MPTLPPPPPTSSPNPSPRLASGPSSLSDKPYSRKSHARSKSPVSPAASTPKATVCSSPAAPSLRHRPLHTALPCGCSRPSTSPRRQGSPTAAHLDRDTAQALSSRVQELLRAALQADEAQAQAGDYFDVSSIDL